MPTAILGGLLASVTLRARSLWPAILLHMAYNASALEAAARSADGSLDELLGLFEGVAVLENYGLEVAAAVSAAGLFLLLRKARTG